MSEQSNLLYERLASTLEQSIQGGVLRPGDRVPSVRQLHQQYRVSPSTAVTALLKLENQGWIEARPRSGFYVRPRLASNLPEPVAPRSSPLATPIGVSEFGARLFEDANRSSVLHLGTACPAPELLPWERLRRDLAAEARRLGPASTSYDWPPGALRLRRSLARRYLNLGCPLSADELIITTGCMEAAVLCLRALCKPGDVVAIESPMFFGLLQTMEELRLRVVEIPAHARTGLDVDVLARTLRRQKIKACVAIPQFNNPLGSLMPESHKKALLALLARHDVPLIEDDIYGDLFFGETRPRPVRSFDAEGRVLLCGSISKTLAPGLRVGWVAPGRYYDRVLALKRTTTIASATLTSLAASEFMDNGGYDHHLRSLRAALRQQVHRVSEAVAHSFPRGVRLSRPQGGLVLWIELPPGLDALQLSQDAVRANISIAPGPLFSPRGGYRNFLRLSCGEVWSPRMERGLATLGQLAHRQWKGRKSG